MSSVREATNASEPVGTAYGRPAPVASLSLTKVGPGTPYFEDASAEFQAALSWDEVKRFKDKWQIPLIIKGIATREDAETAIGHVTH